VEDNPFRALMEKKINQINTQKIGLCSTISALCYHKFYILQPRATNIQHHNGNNIDFTEE
jgi:hypothetical protein